MKMHIYAVQMYTHILHIYTYVCMYLCVNICYKYVHIYIVHLCIMYAYCIYLYILNICIYKYIVCIEIHKYICVCNIYLHIYMLSCHNDFIMSVIKQLLFTATIYVNICTIYVQYIQCFTSSSICATHTHTRTHVAEEKNPS